METCMTHAVHGTGRAMAPTERGATVHVPPEGQHSAAAMDWGAAGRSVPPPLPDPATGQGQFLSVPGAPAGLGGHRATVPAEQGGAGDGRGWLVSPGAWLPLR